MEHPKEKRERGREIVGENDCQNFSLIQIQEAPSMRNSARLIPRHARNQGLKAASNSANFFAETLDARKQWDERKKLSTEESTSRKNTLQKTK